MGRLVIPVLVLILAVLLVVVGGPPQPIRSAQAQQPRPADTWDGLVRIRSSKMDAVYLLPDADFRPYASVMIEPAIVRFKKGWQSDHNRNTTRMPSSQISDDDAMKVAAEAGKGFDRIIRAEFQKAGYAVVDAPGPGVLRIRPAVFDLEIVAPEPGGASRSTSYTMEAGFAGVLVEVSDGPTNAVLGRAVDRGVAGDNGFAEARTRASNRTDFERLFHDWSRSLSKGLGHLKETSPVDTEGNRAG
jgi:hypothetical protein